MRSASWYRYHHLFADVLRTQLRQAYPDQLAELHQRAAEWYEQNGFVSEAIYHALAAGDQLRAARLIENNAMAMLMHGEAVTVLTWIQSIAPLARERPWLGIHQSWAFICTGQFDRIEPVLQEIEERIGLPGSDAGQIKCAITSLGSGRLSRSGEARRRPLTWRIRRLSFYRRATPPSTA